MYKILKQFLMEFFWNTKSNIWIVLIDIRQLQYWRAFEMKLWNAMEYMEIGECIDSQQRSGKQIWEWNMLNKIWLISGLCYKYCLEEIWEGEQLGQMQQQGGDEAAAEKNCFDSEGPGPFFNCIVWQNEEVSYFFKQIC